MCLVFYILYSNESFDIINDHLSVRVFHISKFLNIFVTAPYFIYFSSSFTKKVYEDKNHPQAVNTYICIYWGKNDFSLSLEEEEQNVPECLLLLHAIYTDSHTNVQTHDPAYSVFFRIVSVSSTDVSFTVILWMYYLSHLHVRNIIHT